MSQKILLIEETSQQGESRLKPLLTDKSPFHCEQVAWDLFRPERLLQTPVELVVAVAVPETSAARNFFHWLRKNPVHIPSLAVLPGRVNEKLLQSTVEVTDDFLLWPIREAEFRYRVGRVLGPASSVEDSVWPELMEALGKHHLVGKDPAFVQIVNTLPRIAASDAFVLITGETGTGKELFARAIHHLSRRHNFPFIPFDCAAVPDDLLENELFGHVPGAYTDARTSQSGLVAMAEGGTLFLDEVDSLSLVAQAKLLRFLQERTYKRLGEGQFSQADINVIVATNRDLSARVQNGQFRSDLYFRLNVLQLWRPPLRQRREDVRVLAKYYLESLNCSTDGTRKSLSPGALRKLSLHHWPGNVRELFNVVQRATMLSETTKISSHHISFLDHLPVGRPVSESFSDARAHAIAVFEQGYVEEMLQKHGGNVTQAAREAQKERRGFGRLVKKYNINRRTI